MNDTPVKRNGGRKSVARQFLALQAVVIRNPEKISGDTWQVSVTALPPFVFQKDNLRASDETWMVVFHGLHGRVFSRVQKSSL